MNIETFQGSLRLSEGILIVDAQDRITYINTMMARILKADRKTSVGQPLDPLDKQPWGEGVLKALVAQARGGTAEVTKEIAYQVTGASHHAKMRAFVNGDKTHILIEDVTKEREMEKSFARFVGPSLVDQLKSTGLASFKAERTPMTLLGVCPAEFSFFAERLEPHVLRDFLNDYVRKVVQVAKDSSAAVVKLSVPTILLGYAAPDHARRAVEAARKLAATGKEMERAASFAGIGTVKLKMVLNTGMVVVGPVGSPERMEYTMLGNNVDIVTSQLQTAMAGTTMLTRAVKDELKDWKPDKCRFLDHGPQRIWGIDHPVGIMMLVEE
ncbi:MAG: hypothetical protein HYY18_06990 [Planctomycetes bacterium]|nr:hypothetical protein [Planctomycetota bacterium]